MSVPCLEVRGLTVLVDEDPQSPVLRDLGFRVEFGSVTALVGESGSGKSTAILSVLGLLPPGLRAVEGGIALGGLSDCEFPVSRGACDAWPRGVLGVRVGFVPQDCLRGLDPLRPVRAVLREAVRIGGRTRAGDEEERIGRALRRAGLDEEFLVRLGDRRPGRLSGGQRQRVLIAAAAMNEPQLMMFDEPTTALDPIARDHVFRAIRSGVSAGTGALVVTHDLEAVERFADDVVVLERGRVVESGRVRKVLSRPGHPYTRRLMEAVLRLP